MELKEILLHLRKEKGLSQAELAEELGITRQTISRWESGLATPSAENLIGLSRVYGVTVEEMMQGRTEHIEDADKLVEDEATAKETPPPIEQNTSKKYCCPRKKRLSIGFAAVIGIYVLIYALGMVTHSKSMSITTLILATFLIAIGWIVHTLHKIIMTHKEDAEK